MKKTIYPLCIYVIISTISIFLLPRQVLTQTLTSKGSERVPLDTMLAIKVDLQGGRFESELPFDVPYLLSMKIPNNVLRIDIRGIEVDCKNSYGVDNIPWRKAEFRSQWNRLTFDASVPGLRKPISPAESAPVSPTKVTTTNTKEYINETKEKILSDSKKEVEKTTKSNEKSEAKIEPTTASGTSSGAVVAKVSENSNQENTIYLTMPPLEPQKCYAFRFSITIAPDEGQLQ